MPIAESVKMWLSIAGFLAALASIGLVYLQMRKTHEWNRRKATQDLLFQLVIGDLANFRRTLDVTYGVKLGSNLTFTDCCTRLAGEEEQRSLRFDSRQLLNFFESVCVGMKNNVLDEEICYDYAHFIITRLWLWGKPLAEEMRKDNDTLWIELETYSERWLKRERQERELHKNSRRVPGKRRT